MKRSFTIEINYEVVDRDLLIRAANTIDPDGDFEDDDTNLGAVMTIIEAVGFDNVSVVDHGFTLCEWGVADW